MSETELKFEVPAGSAPALEAHLSQLGATRASIESRYFDTPLRHLAKARVSLRQRKTDQGWEQTVKAPGNHAVDRLEETVLRPGEWGDQGPPVDASLHAGTRAGAALAAALNRAASRSSALAEVYRTVVVRQAVEVEADGVRVEMAFDRGRIVAGDRECPVCELEYELKDGDPGLLLNVARPAIDAHGAWLSTLSKAARGEALTTGDGRFTAEKAQAPCLRSGAGLAAVRRAVVSACLNQVLANASILAAGQCDDEVIHQLRVGLRRLRTAARELPSSSGAEQPARWEQTMADVFQVLGDYRDRGTVAAAFVQDLAAAGAPAPELGPPVGAGPDPVQQVRGAELQHALLDVLGIVVSSDAEDAGAFGGKAQPLLGMRLGKLHATLQKAAKRFEHMDEASQHRVRKRLKRLRYLSELVGSLYRKRRVRRYLDALLPAQDELGRYMDVVVGIALARRSVDAGDAAAWFNVGWLTAQRPELAKGCRKTLEKAARARPFWHHRA